MKEKYNVKNKSQFWEVTEWEETVDACASKLSLLMNLLINMSDKNATEMEEL